MFEYIRGNGFTIKETSAPEYLLGGYFERVKEPKTDNEILTWGSKTYVKCVTENFKNTFVFETSKQHVTMPPDYNPDLDTTDLCKDAEKVQYWKCIGEIQRAVT